MERGGRNIEGCNLGDRAWIKDPPLSLQEWCYKAVLHDLYRRVVQLQSHL